MPSHTAPPSAPMPGSTLSPLQESILSMERNVWRRAAAKDDAIRVRLGISPAAYYVLLSRLVESDAAMAYDPLLVQRLRRRIASRTAADGGGNHA